MPDISQRPSACDKLKAALPEILGKEIAQAIAIWHAHSHWQFYLIFSDGSSYELYGEGPMNGNRHVTSMVPVDAIGKWMEGRGQWSVVVPEA